MEIKELLRKSGLNEYESKVYLALAKLSIAKAGEIYKESGVPQNKVYESLVKLAEKGFVSTLNLTPRKYKVVGTEKFSQIIENKENEIKDMKKVIEDLNNLISQKRFVIEENVIVLKGKKAVVDKLNFSTPRFSQYQYGFSGELKYYPKSARLIKDAIKRGVKFRFLVFEGARNSQDVKKWQNVGVKIRFYQDPSQQSLRYSMFDDKAGRITFGFPEVKTEDDYLTFWMNSSAFCHLLKENFLNLWKKSEK